MNDSVSDKIAAEAWNKIARYYRIQIADGTGIEHIQSAIEKAMQAWLTSGNLNDHPLPRAAHASEDAKRLDWLESTVRNEGGELNIHDDLESRNCLGLTIQNRSLREAIDVAMQRAAHASEHRAGNWPYCDCEICKPRADELIDDIVGDLLRETNIFPSQVTRAKELIRERLSGKQ